MHAKNHNKHKGLQPEISDGSCVAQNQDRLLFDSEVTRELSVASVRWKGHVKRLRLEPGKSWLDVPKSACLTRGDRVIQGDNKTWVPCDNGNCQVLPSYASPVTLTLGGLRLDILIKEITDAKEHASYENLANLHYRGHTVHGRTARLIARTLDPAYPKVIGFIELATPFFMNKPRARILDAHFELDGVSWERWDINSLRKNIHRIVRIARTVVSPEFRGFGIGGLLVEHASIFARHRWQVAGQMPYFLEISADMLKFVPFVRQAGMRYVGETDGNLNRVAKDMSYLIGRFGDGKTDTAQFEQISGILDQQIARMKKSLLLMEEHNLNVNELTKKLRRLSVQSVLKDFDLFKGIVSLPKPTFMMGLNEYSRKFVEDRLATTEPKEPAYVADIQITPLEGPIRLSGLTITYLSRVRRTFATHAIQQAFDISPTDIRTMAIHNLNCDISPGDVVLVEGPSGTGKTTLLESIVATVDSSKAVVEGCIDLPTGFRPFVCRPIRSRKSLIELFADRGIREALHYLGLAGIAEPFLYLKRFEELSKGQQYRAMLAQMLASKCNVWVADEFCSNLDEITANLVADNVQRIARRYGLTVIAATSNPQPFIHSLQPDHVIRLSSSSHNSVVTGIEFIRMLRIRSRRPCRIQRLKVDDGGFLFSLHDGPKHAAIYTGRRQFQRGLMLLSNGDDQELVRVTRCTQRHYGSLYGDDVVLNGFSDVQQLRSNLKDATPGLKKNRYVTIIEFERLYGESENAI